MAEWRHTVHRPPLRTPALRRWRVKGPAVGWNKARRGLGGGDGGNSPFYN